MEPLRPGDPSQVGSYRLTQRLGAGGMGEVFLGSSRAGRLVVVKLVHPELARDAGFRRRFAREIAAARMVGGFYTAQVVDADTDAGRPWLATAYIPGPTLHEAVGLNGPLPESTVRVAAAGLAEGLAAIHTCGITHADLTPRNVILASDGPRVIDFGIAQALDGTQRTVTSIIGTPGFMSPEQARGDQVTPASDVFSLGAVLTYAAAGHTPFGSGQAHAVMYRVVHEDPDLSGVPSGLVALIRDCLAKDPADRPGLSPIIDQLASDGRPGTAWLPSGVTMTIPKPGLSKTRRETPQASPIIEPPGGSRRPSRRAFIIAGLSAGAVATAGGVGFALASSSASTSRPVSWGVPMILSSGGSNSVAISPDGRTLASAGDSSTVTLWDVSTRMPRSTFSHKPVSPFSGEPVSQLEANDTQFTYPLYVTFSPVGTNLAVGNGDGSVSIWDVGTRTEVVLPSMGTPTYGISSINVVAFHPSGRMLASTFSAPTVRVWNLPSQQVIATLDAGGDTYWTGGLVFTPTGGILVTSTGNRNPPASDTDGSLQFWAAPSYAGIATLAQTNTAVYGLAISPDSKTLAALGENGTITLWDIPTRTRSATLTRDGSGVTCIALGPGDLLAAGLNDGTVTLWDTAKEKSIATLSTDSSGAVNCIAISPDGKTIASGGANLTIWTAD